MKDPIPKTDREKSSWLDCEVWRHIKQSGASLNSEWGLQRALELRWCTNQEGKNHLCSFSDKEHKIFEDHEKRKLAGKEHGSTYDTTKSFFKHMKHDCDKLGCKPFKTTTDKYGNETRYFK